MITPEDIVNKYHETLASQTSSPARAQSPYLNYGAQDFDTNISTMPRVCWKKGDLTLGEPIQTAGVGITGSVGSMEQELICRIYGLTEASVLAEYAALKQAILDTKVIGGVTQPPLDDIRGTWLERRGDNYIKGHALEFTIDSILDIERTGTELVTILTASVTASMSGTALSSFFLTLTHDVGEIEVSLAHCLPTPTCPVTSLEGWLVNADGHLLVSGTWY